MLSDATQGERGGDSMRVSELRAVDQFDGRLTHQLFPRSIERREQLRAAALPAFLKIARPLRHDA